MDTRPLLAGDEDGRDGFSGVLKPAPEECLSALTEAFTEVETTKKV